MKRLTDQQIYRFYEMIPGLFIWIVLLGSIILSIFKPVWVIYFILVFDLYWLVRIVYFSILLMYSWHQYQKTVKIDWLEKTKKNLGWEDIYHLVFFATYKEDVDVIATSFESLIKNNYPLDKFIVVLAGEERDKEHFLQAAEIVKKRFGDKFLRFFITVHPKDVVGEIPGKGSNLHWAGHQAQKLIDELNITYEKIIVSSFDIDTCVHSQYFSYLTYVYLTTPNPTNASYQPVALFNNNIWESPVLTRLVARGTTFWLLTELSKPQLYFTFSSHSLSFKTLVDIGFWQKDVVTEDSRIFLQCFNHYNGDYRTVPLYISVSMDTVYCGSLWKTLVNQYKQMLRWGYGVENVPWMLWNFSRNKKMPFWQKIKPFWLQFEGSCTWAIVPIMIFVLGNLPIYIAHIRERTEAIVQNAPFILERIMGVAMIGIVLAAILSTILLPPRPSKSKLSTCFWMLVQWLIFPFTMIIFGSIPAAEGITRLMLGKYLGFRVTEKKRAS